MNSDLRSSQSQFNESIPARSKHRLSIFVWVCWQWHKQMRENKANVKNKLEFLSWNEPHSLPRRLAIALRDREANPHDITNYNDPFFRLGNRYRAYWQDHLELHEKVFSNNEPELDTPKDYVKPVFSFGNSFPNYENTKDATAFNTSEINSGICNQNNGSSVRVPFDHGHSSTQNSVRDSSVNERPKPPSSYIESPELVALLNHIHSRNHAICLSMIIDFSKYGELCKTQNDRKRLHEILICAGFSSEFISQHEEYMEYFIHNLQFVHADLWKIVYSSIRKSQNSNQEVIVNTEHRRSPTSPNSIMFSPNINSTSLNSRSSRIRG